jgi:dissimilatory sulfite reductase (desulfoviridin) alpha/beta subunit
MEWEKSALEKLEKAPFFVRKLVRNRVEEYVHSSGRTVVTESDVVSAKQKYMSTDFTPSQNAEPDAEQITSFVEQVEQNSRQTEWSQSPRYYSVKVCGAPFGCPRAVVDVAGIGKKIVELMEQQQFANRIQTSIGQMFLPHHRFKIALAGCPNACSEPQIKDFGLIGQAKSKLTDKACIECMKCVEVCKEEAINVKNTIPEIDFTKCILCGDCAAVCPTGTICIGQKGYRILVGGKLGRHPQFAWELDLLANGAQVLKILEKVLNFYCSESKNGERLGTTISRLGFEVIKSKIINQIPQ